MEQIHRSIFLPWLSAYVPPLSEQGYSLVQSLPPQTEQKSSAFHYLLSCQFHLLHRSDSLQNPASSAKNLKHLPHYDQIWKAWTPVQTVPHLFHSQYYPTFSEIPVCPLRSFQTYLHRNTHLRFPCSEIPHIFWVFLSEHLDCIHLPAWLWILWYIYRI